MKTTIIKILDKIANGEEVPKKIKYLGHIYNYDYKDVCYYDVDKQDLLECVLFSCKYTAVNEKVEILDEPKEDKIKKIKYDDAKNLMQGLATDNLCYTINAPQKVLLKKINELIDKVNKLI